METIPHYLKKSVYSGFAFFMTVLALSVWYATLNGGLSITDKVNSGSGLTASSWNRIIDGVLDLDTKVTNLQNTGLQIIASGTTSVPGSSYVTVYTWLPKTEYYQAFITPTWATAWCGYVYPTWWTDGSGLIGLTLWNNASCGGTVQWKIVRIK